MSNVSQIYGTLRDSEPYIILNSTQTEISSNLAVLQNLDVCGNITFNNTDLSTALSNLVVDLTGGQDASFNNVDITNELNVLSSNGSTGTIRTQNYYVGSRPIISGSAQATFGDLELKDSNTNVLNFLASGSSGDVSMNGTLNVGTINHANGVNIEGVTIQNNNVTMNGNLTLNNIDVSGKLTQIDASLVPLASSSSGGTIASLYDLIPNVTNSSAIIDVITNNFKETWWHTYTYSYNAGASNIGGRFNGGVLAPNGKIILVPYKAANIGIYDPIANTFTNGKAHGQVKDTFAGGVLAPNGKIIFVPLRSANVGIYDPITDTYTSGDTHGEASPYFYGGVLAPNGKIIFVPLRSANVGIYDPITNNYTSGPAHNENVNINAFTGGVLAPNGKIIFVPFGSSNVGIYDPITNTYTSGAAHNEEPYAFRGGVLAPNGKIIFVPSGSANVGIYDPDTDTYTSGAAHNETETIITFTGGVLAPNGKIIFVPSGSANVGIYDPITNTYTSGPAHNQGNSAFYGGVLAPNGNVIFIPFVSSNVGIYSNGYQLKPKSIDTILMPYFNKF